MNRVSWWLSSVGVVITTLGFAAAGLAGCISVQRAAEDVGGTAEVETAAGPDTAVAPDDVLEQPDAGPPAPACEAGEPICSADDGAVVSCVEGELVTKTCDPHTACFSGSCEALLDCATLTECYFGCSSADLDVLALVACQQSCIDHGEGDAAEQFTAIYSCLNAGCATISDQEDGLLCLFLECPEDTSLCLYGDKGEASCVELLECIGACDTTATAAEQEACGLACYREATPSAHLKFLKVTLCIADACEGALDEVTCWVESTQFGGGCAPDWLACQTD